MPPKVLAASHVHESPKSVPYHTAHLQFHRIKFRLMFSKFHEQMLLRIEPSDLGGNFLENEQIINKQYLGAEWKNTRGR